MSLRRLLSIAPLTNDHVTLRRPRAGDAETIARYIGHKDSQAWLSGSEKAHVLYSEYTAGWNAPDDRTRLGLTLIVTRSGDDTLVGVMSCTSSRATVCFTSDTASHRTTGGSASPPRRADVSSAISFAS
jgi:hypothetical protein